MDKSSKHLLSPSFRMDMAALELAGVDSLAALEHIWNDDIPAIIAHDCAVMGEADLDQNGISIRHIVLRRGVFHDEPLVLLARCASLLATWNVMRNACLMDLGPCMCIGARLLNRQTETARSFLVHGKVLNEQKIYFLVFSSLGWKEEGLVKRLMTRLIDPMADAVARLTAPQSTAASAPIAPAHVRLTAREIEIINWLVEGRTNKEIARFLGTSPNTVRNQIARLAEKSGARNRAQLAAMVASLR